MKLLRLLVFLLLPLSGTSQTIKGYIYDAETTIKGAKLINSTQNSLTYSDDKGYFEISAKPNDTIVSSSYFHESQTLVVTSNHFNKTIVIELKKITNQLDEVDITKVNDKAFDSLSIKNTTAKHGQIAFKERIFGSGKNLQPTINIIRLAEAIGKLFKKEKTEVPYIKTSDLINVFETSDFFNNVFLQEELGIIETYHYLFFEYVQAQQIHAALLSKDKELELLDKLLQYSKAFHKLLTEHQSD